MKISQFKQNDTIISTESKCKYKVLSIGFDVVRGKKKPVKSHYTVIESECGKYRSKIYHSQTENFWRLAK